MNRKILILTIVIILSTLVTIFFNNKDENTTLNENNIVTNEHVNEVPIIEEKEYSVTISAVGDILIHDTIYKSSKVNNTYDFRNIFEPVKQYIESCDIAIANLEVPVADESFSYSNYPAMNCPKEILDGLKYAGFDIVTNANNHTLDRGEKGLLSSIDNIKKSGLLYTGTSENEENSKPLVIEKNNIKIGLFSYTYGTNGIPIPKGKDYLVNIINTDNIKNDIDYLKSQNVDFIISSIHFGVEYRTKSNNEQKELAKFLIENGVDVILGSHPHVLEEAKLESININGNKKNVFYIYSMGNFIADQYYPNTNTGVIVQLELYKNTKTGNTINSYKLIPTYIDKYLESGKNKWRVIPIKDTIDKYLNNEKNISESKYKVLKKELDNANSILNYY
ncbi:MAG: CapA family protein [Clostridia bacterium]|nr:CapA family protein [Clostridia bacterium]